MAVSDSRTVRIFLSSTFLDFAEIVGFKYLMGMHLNDSKKELGSRIDRHASLGEGKIGLHAFRILMQDERFNGIPLILETPDQDKWKDEITLLRQLE